ncbi:MAG: thiosulfate/3-mercaptopyruvate sulfurtransferase [Thermoleophilaceae bacterium]|nr:thiosulfate/3-mercaptopyruvate sulfurtransferase [Thermoleophilaceae bacterium]
MTSRFGPLVQPEWLRDHLGQPGLAVVDCRFVLGEPGAGEHAWLGGHIPGAAALDLDRDLSAQPGAGGRHPLPAAERFEAAARRAGVGDGVRVVAYDEAGGGGAARLWWLLRHFGHDDVAVLDGGLRAWREAGGELRVGSETPPAGDFVAQPREGDTVSADQIELGGARLHDARAAERFRGDTEPIDAVAGHIPGARNVPSATVAPQGRFLAPAELRKRLGDEPFVAYCGSGVTACTLLVAAELAGVEARLYPGSWSEWSASGRPVATGES